MPEPLLQCAAWLDAYFREPAVLKGLPVPALHHPIFQKGQYHSGRAASGSGSQPPSSSGCFPRVNGGGVGRTARPGAPPPRPLQVLLLVLAHGPMILGKGNKNDPCTSTPASRWLRVLKEHIGMAVDFSISLLLT